ncbi:hypothetical protein BV394_08845 [Brevirhabdus pacifica]|uniref:Protein SCO1/2 n=1 Tax=Brevirhabdus pacifica TaxID=1267768 RepID=A0A1U7DIH4_9RHOB|nr:hypothetical protein BV394_08845 [Brevirhabdus pacifica]
MVLLLLGVLGYMVLVGPDRMRLASCEGAGVAGADIGGPFTLVDETGRTVTDKDVITGPTLVYFGFTNCPDVCPVDSARNAVAVTLLEQRGIEATPVLITVDPQRDTPAALAEYTDNFHERMLGLTGSKEQIADVTSTYRVYASRTVIEDEADHDAAKADEGAMNGAAVTGEAMKEMDHSEMKMTEAEGGEAPDHSGHGEIRVDHSAYTYLMLPGTGLADFFDREISAEGMADRVSCALQKN